MLPHEVSGDVLLWHIDGLEEEHPAPRGLLGRALREVGIDMAVPFTKERRLAPRQKLTGLMPGKFVAKATGKSVSCRPIDVSESGLGILTAQELALDSILTLTAGDQEIDLKVLWRKPDFGKNNLMRYGLACAPGTHVNLAAVFVAQGCLK